MLFLTAFGNLIRAIHRLILVAARICCIAQSDTPLVKELHFLQLMGIYIFLFGFMFVVVERAIASVFSSTYELKCMGYTVPIALYGVVTILSTTSTCVVWFQLCEFLTSLRKTSMMKLESMTHHTFSALTRETPGLKRGE
ncbi:hypothetical protein ANCCAN_08635 [Ancylostoma caninum]|uniref:Uncharacterized protein n=1 Tax=Ancylostoma caninum TaxID=29170 RepID=A0A368GLX1_ANCCA|nr:hypothetical protein ANCCAN_08635 [Ancylostoma caninum]